MAHDDTFNVKHCIHVRVFGNILISLCKELLKNAFTVDEIRCFSYFLEYVEHRADGVRFLVRHTGTP